MIYPFFNGRISLKLLSNIDITPLVPCLHHIISFDFSFFIEIMPN